MKKDYLKTLKAGFYILLPLAILLSCKSEKEQSTDLQKDTTKSIDSTARTIIHSDKDEIDPAFAVGTTLSSDIVKKHLLKSINEKKIKKNKSLTILGSMKSQPKIPLKNYILLANESNTIIDRTALTKEGRFKFEKLQAGIYNVLIEKPSKDLDISVETQFVDESSLPTTDDKNESTELVLNKILSPAFVQKHLLFPLPSAQVKVKQGNIEGIIVAKENTIIDNLEILLINDAGKILNKTRTNKDGKFSFTKLPPDNYSLILAQNNPNISAKLLTSQDNTNIPTTKEEINSLEINARLTPSYVQKNKVGAIDNKLFRDDFGNLKGKIIGSSGIQTIIISDLSNKIVRIEKSTANGAFNFSKLPLGDYQLLIDNKPAGITVQFTVEVDESELKEVVQAFSFEVNNKVPKNIIATNGLGEIEVGNIKNLHGFFHENLGKQKKSIPNEAIMILDNQDKIIMKTNSDTQGKFSFTQLKSGKYTLLGKRNFSKMNVGLDLTFKQNSALEENQY